MCRCFPVENEEKERGDLQGVAPFPKELRVFLLIRLLLHEKRLVLVEESPHHSAMLGWGPEWGEKSRTILINQHGKYNPAGLFFLEPFWNNVMCFLPLPSLFLYVWLFYSFFEC